MHRTRTAFAVAALITFASPACDDVPRQSMGPGGVAVTLRVIFQGPTERDPDLPPAALPCVTGVGATHIHPSWRDFAGIPMVPVPPSRYEIVFTDAPVNTRLTFRVNDQNFCDENPTGAVTGNIIVNDVRLTQNTITPVDEPGFAFTLAPDGTVTQ
jgi:hypothetical protein